MFALNASVVPSSTSQLARNPRNARNPKKKKPPDDHPPPPPPPPPPPSSSRGGSPVPPSSRSGDFSFPVFKEKSPDLDDGGTGLPPRDDDGGGGGGGGGGGWSSGGFFFFGFLAFLGFLKDQEKEGAYRD
nr:hypothetical protein [Tanacetum cinerariifolium]